MTRRQFARFIVAIAAAAVAVHVLSALLITAGLYVKYPHRIFNVHQWSNDNAENFRLVGTFLRTRARSQTRPVMVFAGSSVSYGDVWPARVTFAHLIAERRTMATVLNASIIAADVSAVNDWIVCGARRNQIHVAALLIELPVVNSLTYLINHQRASGRVPALNACEAADQDPDYVGLAFTRFRGTAWLRFLWHQQPAIDGERPIKIVPVPKGYFASAADFGSVRALFMQQIADTLTSARRVADVVYAFPSPVYLPGLRQVGEDDRAVEEQLHAAHAACTSVPGIRCIDASRLYAERSDHSNLTHLNLAGHRAMADLLDGQIAQ